MAEFIEPTIIPAMNFNALEDAKGLRAAMKGFGTDEEKIIHVLAHRSNQQRQDISAAFKSEFGRDLLKDLKSELGGKFEKLILALMEKTYEYLAKELHGAMAKIGTDEDVLTEILCSRSNSDVQQIARAYSELYGKSLESEIGSEVSGDYKRLLTLLLSAYRTESMIDPTEAFVSAEKLFIAGEKRFGTDEEAFVTILSHQSFPQLKLVFDEYKKLSGRTFEEAAASELSGDLKEAVLTIAKCATNRPLYFAEKLKKAMKGAGTDDSSLIRIIVSRAEFDLGAIRREYATVYHKTLVSAIFDETSGDYRTGLINIVGGV